MSGAKRILLVDDEKLNIELLEGMLVALGHECEAARDGMEALARFNADIDLILMDVMMPGMDGFETVRSIRAGSVCPDVPIIMVTALTSKEDRLNAVDAGANDYIAKPVDRTELKIRVSALLRVKTLLDQLERAEAVITTLALTIEARDPYTLGHCDRLSRYAMAVGDALGLDTEMKRALRLGGYLHDLGKISVPDRILLKPGPLDPIEQERIRAHPGAGSDLVLGLRSMELVRPIMRHHHEKWDGSGYPDGLKGETIPLGARIISVVDVFDALHTDRPYKAALPRSEAVSLLLRETDAGYWDPRVVDTFLDILRQYQ